MLECFTVKYMAILISALHHDARIFDKHDDELATCFNQIYSSITNQPDRRVYVSCNTAITIVCRSVDGRLPTSNGRKRRAWHNDVTHISTRLIRYQDPAIIFWLPCILHRLLLLLPRAWYNYVFSVRAIVLRQIISNTLIICPLFNNKILFAVRKLIIEICINLINIFFFFLQSSQQ